MVGLEQPCVDGARRPRGHAIRTRVDVEPSQKARGATERVLGPQK